MKTKKVDVAVFLPSLEGGGAEKSMVTLANGFANKGLNVDLVLSNAIGPFVKELDEKINMIDLRCSRIIFSLPGLIHYLKKHKPDSILSAMTHANIVAIIAKLLSGSAAKIMVTERANRKLIKQGSPRPSIEGWLDHLIPFFYSRANLVVALTNGMKKSLIENYPKMRTKVVVIYNPVVGEKMLLMAQDPVHHEWLDSERTVPVVLGVGRLTPQKDWRNLFNAIKQVNQTRPIRLIILGDGEERSELQRVVDKLGISKMVHFAGFVDNPYCWMKACDVFVLSSHQEGLPGVLIQAMACGAKVISTDNPTGPREVLEDGLWGRLVPLGDSNELAKSILESLDCEHTIGTETRALVFSEDKIIEQYLTLLEKTN